MSPGMLERVVDRLARARLWAPRDPWRRFLIAVVLELLVAAPFVWVSPASLRGVPGPLLIVIGLATSLLLGWRFGVLAMLLAVTLGVTLIAQNPLVTPLLWLPAALLAGLVGDAMRHGEALRREVVHQLYAGLVALSRDPVIGPLAVHTRYLPAEAEQVLAGDFYGVLEGPNREAFIMVGDVSGHGPAAAATATHLRAAWRGLAASAADLAEIARILNDLLHAEQRGGTDLRFATLCLAAFSPDLMTAQFLVAGHPPPLLVFDDECIELGLVRQPALGIVPAWDWQPQEIPLPDSDWSMIVYTDGLVEGRSSPTGPRPFGMSRLCELLTRRPLPITDASIDEVLDAIRTANGGPMTDDIVAIAVSPAAAGGERRSAVRVDVAESP
jgi:hypothetical protein